MKLLSSLIHRIKMDSAVLVFLLMPVIAHCEVLLNPGPIVHKLTVTNQAVVSGVKDVIRAENGTVWFASDNGLLRLDGDRVVVFKPDFADPLVNEMVGLVEDEKGIIWLLTKGRGLLKFEPASQTFTQFVYQSEDDNSLNSNVLSAMAVGKNGVLWISSDKGINQFDRITGKNRRLDVFLNENSPSSTYVETVFLDSQNRLWLSAPEVGLLMHNLSSKEKRTFAKSNAHEHQLVSRRVLRVKETDDGSIWVGSWDGLFRYIEKSESFEHFTMPYLFKRQGNNNASVTDIAQGPDGSVWVSSFDSGVGRVNKSTKKVEVFGRQSQFQTTANIPRTYRVQTDKFGRMWIVSASEGVYYIDNDALNFEHRELEGDDRKLLIKLVSDDSGDFWFVKNFSLFRYNSESATTDKITDVPGIVRSLGKGIDGKLFVSIVDKGIWSLDKNTLALVPVFDKSIANTSYSHGDMYFMGQENEGNIWGALINNGAPVGLFRSAPDGQEQTLYLPNTWVNELVVTSDFVVATTRDKGVWIFDKSSTSWSQLKSEEHYLRFTWDLFMDSKKRVWLSNLTDGLLAVDLKTKSTANALVQETQFKDIRCIAESSPDELILVGTESLYHYQVSTKSLTEINHQNWRRGKSKGQMDCASNHFGDIAIAQETQVTFTQNLNELVRQRELPGIESLTLPAVITVNESGSLDVLDNTQFHLNDDNVPPVLSLDHDSSFVTFEYYQINHPRNAEHTLSYRIKGLQDGWSPPIKNKGNIEYRFIPVGQYELEVKSTNLRSQQSQVGSFQIVVNPPWWRNNAAYLVYFWGLLVLIYGVIHYRTRQLVARAGELEKAVNDRTNTINEMMAQKDRMFSNVSHELRTPLTLIQGPIQSLLRNSQDIEQRKTLELVKRNTERLASLVDQFLELARAEAKTSLGKKWLEMKSVVESIATAYHSLVEQKHQELTISCEENVFISIAPESLEVIINNLMSNAIKYTPEKGKIRVSAYQTKDDVRIEVSDTGLGIAKEEQELVFKRFTRSVDEHVERIQGTGIGLALVRELVESSDGGIEMESQVGVGTRFIVRFPKRERKNSLLLIEEQSYEIDDRELVEEKLKKIQLSNLNDELIVADERACILVIDDHLEMLDFVSGLFEDDYQCIKANNGEEGITQAVTHIPNLVICDLMMPGFNGYQVAQYLRDNELTSHIPIIMLTAKGDVESRLKGWEANVDDYITKPFNIDELQLRVQNLLETRRMLKLKFSEKDLQQFELGQQGKTISDKDYSFIEKFRQVVEAHYANEDFNRAKAASELAISDKQLYRKLSMLLEQNFTEYLRQYRLQKAIELLRSGRQISQIAHDVGFNSLSYFIHCFKQEFGDSPKRVQESLLK